MKSTFRPQDIPSDLFPWCCSCSSFSSSKVIYLSIGIFYVLLWSLKEKSLLIALTLENHKGKGSTTFKWSGWRRCSKMFNWRLQIMQDRKMALKLIFSPNWQYVNILNCSEAWQPQIQVEGDIQTSFLTYESIYAKFPAYHYGTAWFRLNHLVDLALSKKTRDQKLFSTQQGQCIPWSCLLHQWGMAAGGNF